MSRLRRPMHGAFIIFACLLPLVVSCDDGKKKTEPAGVPSAARSTVTVAAARYDVVQERFIDEVTVVIRDRDDAPLSGVVVSLLLEEGHELAPMQSTEATTDDEGVAVLSVTGNSYGSRSFRVRAVSPLASVDPVILWPLDAYITFFVTLEAAPDGEPTYVWDAGTHPFRLTLLDPAGPVAGARLTAQVASEDLAVTPEVATTDASGQAAFVVESTRTGQTSLFFELAGIVDQLHEVVELVPFGHGSLRPACQFAPDPSRTAYFPTPVVVVSDWGEPVPVAAPLADACPNDAIALSPDGTRLYVFWSPVVNGDAAQSLHEHTGTYVAERVGADPGVFSYPRYYKLSRGVEGASVDGKPSFTDDGFVVFHSTRAANLGFQADPPTDDFLDVYRAPILDGEPGTAVNLGAPINSTYLDGEHGLGPDGTLYISSDRPGGQGGVDIYSCPPSAGGWGAPENPGTPLNTDQWEGQPGFSAAEPDTMYFVSNRDGPSAIYRSTWTGSAWSVPELVITGYVGEPSFTAAGDILYFVHVLVDADGVFGSNIWYVRRR